MSRKEEWNTFLQTKGLPVLAVFEDALAGSCGPAFADAVRSLHRQYCPSRALTGILHDALLQILEDRRAGAFTEADLDLSADSVSLARALLYGDDPVAKSDLECFRDFEENLFYLSTFLALQAPERFLPYYFYCRFDLLCQIAKHFGIVLPPLPAKKDFRGRLLYYGALCSSLQAFRRKEGLTPAGLWLFLYGYAPLAIRQAAPSLPEVLPPARHACLVCTSRDDPLFSEKPETVVPRPASPEIKRGDFAVQFLRVPDNAATSVWRFVSDAFTDPFYFHYTCAYTAHPKKLKTISLRWMQKDHFLGRSPLVRKHLIGASGTAIPAEGFNHLMELAGEAARL